MIKRRSTRFKLMLAALGSAVGLANMWGFPYKFHSGGLVFLIFFIIFISIFAIFGLSAELAVGRLSKSGALGAYENSFVSTGKKQKLGKFVGYIPIMVTILMSIGYAAITSYILKGLVDSVTGDIFLSSSKAWFDSYALTANSLLAYHSIIVLLAIFMCQAQAVFIRRVYNIMMPVFFILLIIVAIQVETFPHAIEGLRKLFTYDPTTMNLHTILYSMGEAFFSLAMTGAGMIIAGHYLTDDEDLVRFSSESALFDSLVGINAALVILPAITAFGMEDVGGPSLLFVTLPEIFANIPLGRFLAIFFYLAITFAGISNISFMFQAMGESISFRHKKLSKPAVFTAIGIAVFILGIKLETVDHFSAYMNILLVSVIPLGATIGAITWFYVLDKETLLNEINRTRTRKFGKKWYALGKYLYVPLAVILTIIGTVSVLS